MTQPDHAAAPPTDDEAREPDFSCLASEGFHTLLKTLGISLVLTSYQANRVILVRAGEDQLNISLKAFPRPMGLAVDAQRIVLGIHAQLIDFRRFDAVAPDLEPVGQVDACFVPRSTHITGMINVHDIAWGDAGLWVTNSAFSCLSLIRPDSSFVPMWKPPFISALVNEDRCHLNGLAMRDGKPRYVTMFSHFDERRAWRSAPVPAGKLMDIDGDRILVDGLLMPHSPRWHDGHIYYCNSGHGSLCRFDPESGASEEILRVPGFTRGIGFHGPLLFLGLSRSRRSEAAARLPLNDAHEDTIAGLIVFDLERGEIIERLEFTGDVHQIYDVGVIAGASFPDLLNIDDELVSSIFEFPAMPGQPQEPFRD